MGVRFIGNGTGTSSIAFTTVNLRAPTVSTSGQSNIDQTEILTSESGIRSTYKHGQRQLQFDFIWHMLDVTEYEALKEFLEQVDGSNNWFTLQDHFIPKKDNINCQTLADDDTVYNTTDLASATWPDKPIGKYVFATLGANNNARRRIVEYIAGGPSVRVSPAFASVFNIVTPDTFLIGTPVVILPENIRFVPRLNNFWDVAMTFIEKGD